MSKLILGVFSLVGLISACVGQGVLQAGQCDETINVVTNFNENEYLGVWYDIESLPSTFQSGTCNTATYGLNTAGSLSVQNTQVSNGVLAIATGTATVQAGVPAGTAKYNVLIGTGTTVAVPYWVLDTDYTTFALMYSCTNEPNNQRRVNSWKLGRNKGALPAAATTRINSIISSVAALNQVAQNDWVVRDHTAEACSYFVDFDGVCPTVTGVANFDVNRYIGTWYEVARYPQSAQTGQCNRAEYTQGVGVVNVQNSQVTNQALGTISGTATTTAQSGVLAVTLIIGGVPSTQNLVVLATDYDNYALVYSCVDLGGNRRRIGSWQLRKNFNELSAAATTAINNAILATPDLEQAFYQQTSQTDAACFYYPNVEDLPDFIDLPGPCDTTITGVANFDVNRYLGTWYEVARYPQSAQTGQCNRAEYSQGAGVVNVQNRQVTNQALGTISGTATTTAQSGVLAVTLNVGGELRTTNLHVLATDYDNYALLYSCVNIEGNQRRVGSWQMRKNFEPLTAAATTVINTAIANTEGLRSEYYRETSQTDAACFYYPNIEDLPDFIDLPGPCDTTITGVANFDVNRYLGTWYEVARYPQSAQTGQCNRAEYSQGAGVVNVQNRQVTNQALGTISGTATTTAQSGVLAVTLNVGGELRTTNLHVLATDYDNYALLYSCVNIEGNQRRVGSWQMRKNFEPLTAAATTVINTAIANTEGLRSEYYRETSQTDAACFYYPNIEDLPDFIDLPGSCDTTITGVANFDVNRYLGTWYEVARYPQSAQTGQCNRAEYSQGAGVVNVQNRQVTNQALGTISGTATTTAQSGVLAVTLNVGGELRTTNLHVLATDYDNYALLYSCVNIEGNQRRVGSWQMRKNFEPLTAAATTAINNAIANTEGLRAEYYRETSQTDAACFYYPVFEQLPDVIELPGPCDTSITGVANFDVTRYLGTWLEVARYPQPTQTGQCNRAQYGQGTGVVTVLNSQVISEVLYTISGQAATTAQSGVLAVTLNVGGEPRTTNLHVLATDYDNYALAYTCTNIEGNRRQVGSWQLRRNLNPLTEAATNAINNAIANTEGLRPEYYQQTSQTTDACWHYLPQAGEKVVIPGQCDTQISGVANIDTSRFADDNVWYQINRYDAVGERSCIGTRLTEDGDYINVNYIEVIGEEATRVEGIARVSNAATGKFDLEMTDSEKEEIYILATDYDNYAIGYSCKNEDTETRQIGAWQLSRTRSWPAAGNTALQRLIAERQEITDAATYFKAVPQNEECPEPSSAFLFRSSIIVMFVCTVLHLVW